MRKQEGAESDSAADYRMSHLERGGDYDGRIAASSFDAYMAKWEAYWLTRTIQRLYPSGVPRYLDFACGTGRITQVVAPLARESVAVDISTTMLEVARKKCPGVRFVQADVTRENRDFGLFDVVTAFRFFGNAEDELRAEALSALCPLLRPGGHLILNSHRNPFSLAAVFNRVTGGSDEMDLNYFKLKRLLTRHGVKIVRVRAIGFWLFRSRMLASVGLESSTGILEQIFQWPVFAPLSPDTFVVARKA